MPLMRCQVDGKFGWKYGPNGHCYTGPDAKKKAIEQMKAMIAAGYKPKRERKEQK